VEINYIISILWRLLRGFPLPYVLPGKYRKEFLVVLWFCFHFELGLMVISLNNQVRYSRLLEEGDFRGRTANYVLMLLFGIACISLVAVYTHVHFLGSALTFMMVYVWGRRNEDVKMSFLGFFQFNAPYLPWVMLGFSILLGNGITMDIIGIAVGHTYYFLEYVLPVVAEIRGWRTKKFLQPPALLHWVCGSYEHQNLHHD
jgi:hypothetical protein